MRITRIEATPLAIPLVEEFHWAGGAQVGANLVLFTVHTDEGVTGYGESICEDQRAVAAYGELIARQFVGRSPGDVEAILRSVWTEGRWKMFPQFTNLLVAGLEVACWDALGRALEVPSRTFFGGSVHDEIDYFGFLQGDEPEQLAAHARGSRARATASSTSRSAAERATTTRASRRCARRSGPSRCSGSTRTRPGTARPPSTGSAGSSSTTSTGSSSRRRPET